MRYMKSLLTALNVLALTLAAVPAVASAATPGFHAAYFSESAFLSLQPGQTGQFSVGYSNTGDQAWVKGLPGQTVSLHTAAPLDNTVDYLAGWGPTWTAPNVYARQLNDLVAPGQIGFFTYSVTVPQTAATGAHVFYGRPVIEGVGPLEDYGYYQQVTVTAAVTFAITSSNPATPSISATPNIIGVGAPPVAPVNILEGSTTVGTGTSGSDGSFSVSVTTTLSSGAHSLVATATGPSGVLTTAPFTYTVGTTTTTPSTTPATSSGSLTLTRPGTHSMIITFPRAVNSGPATTATNFKWDSATFPSTPTLQTGSLAVRLDFPSGSLPGAGTHTLDIYGITYQDGTAYSPNPTSFTVVTTSDTTLPSVSGASATAATTIDVTFSEAMRTTAYFAASTSIDTASNFTLTNPDGSAATTGGSSGSGSAITVTSVSVGGTSSDNAIFNETKARLTLSNALAANVSYRLTAQSVADQAGNILVSGSAGVSYASSSTLPTVSSVAATQRSLTVTYSKAMAHAATANATAAACSGSGTQIDNKSNYTLSGTMATALASSLTTCHISANEQIVTFTFDPSVGVTQATYTYSIAGVADNISSSNLISPNPTTGSVFANQSAPAVAAASRVSATQFTVRYSEAMNATALPSDISALNPANYLVTGGSGFGDLCGSLATTTVTTSDNILFTVTCSGDNGKWGGAGTNVLQVRRVVDSDAGAVISPSPYVKTF